MSNDERRLVYSTDGSLPLPKAVKRSAAPVRAVLPQDGVVRVGCERRRGGSSTLIHGLDAGELHAVGTELKRLCGTGGSVKDGIVSLQGDKRSVVIAYFAERGRPAKRMGGP